MKRAAASCLLAAALAAGCGGGSSAPAVPAPAPTRGGTVVLGSISDVDSWNEYLSRQAFAAGLVRRIFLWLASEQVGPPGAPATYAPQLAESWSFSDDGRALTFHLRAATWSDGKPITADDVRFTWEVQTSPDLPWTEAQSKRHIRDVEVVDPRTVTFHFDRRYPWQLADAVEGGILPRHAFGSIPLTSWTTHDWSTLHIGSGPFVLESHRPGEEIVLARNPRYFRAERPLVDRVVVRIVPDIQNLITQLQAGDIDFVQGIPPREAERLRARGDVELLVYDAPQFDYLGWNGSRAPFSDPAMRRAMTLAIDREALVEDLLYGLGRVSKGPLLSWRWGAAPHLVAWRHDPDEARRILAERGWRTSGADGATLHEGRPLEIELVTNAGNQIRQDALVKIQEQLARIGVRAAVRPLEMRALRENVARGAYDGYLGGWVFYGKVDLASLFGSTATPPEGANMVFYRSPEVDRLLAALDAAETADAALAPLAGLQEQIHEDQPYTFLFEQQRVAGHGRRLHGLGVDEPADALASLESWWVDPR